MFGLAGDTYSGFTEIGFNPALGVSSRNYMEINFLTGGAFFRNNYLYFHQGDYSMGKLLRANPQLPYYGVDSIPFDYYNNSSLKNGYLNSRFTGPGFLKSQSDLAFGFSINSGINMSFTDLPANLANIIYNRLHVPSQYLQYYENHDFSVSGMAEIDYQFHLSGLIKQTRQDQLTAGINFSIIRPYAGAYLDAENFNYTLIDDSTLDIRNFNGNIGFSLPFEYSDTTFTDPSPNFKGSGFDLDIGFVYTRLTEEPIKHRYLRSCEESYRDYLYRFGISLVDIGSTSFRHNTRLHRFYDVRSVLWDNLDSISYATIDTLFNDLSLRFLNDTLASLSGQSFRLWQPATLNLLADFHIAEVFYLNSRAIIPLAFSPNQLHVPAYFSVIPRYEKEHLSISLPVSFYEFRKMQMGLAFRFHYFSFGTDRLGTWLGVSDFTGIDFYFSIRYFLLKGECKSNLRSGNCSGLEYR